MKRAWIVIVVVVLAVAAFLLVTGPSDDEFRETDPTGYEACTAFASAQGAGGETYHDRIGRAASLGVAADTSALADNIDDGTGERDGDPVIDDLGGFEDACSDAGYDF